MANKLIENIKGSAKELVGRVTGDKNLSRAGEAQQEKSREEEEAERKRLEAEQARKKAQGHEGEQKSREQ